MFCLVLGEVMVDEFVKYYGKFLQAQDLLRMSMLSNY